MADTKYNKLVSTIFWFSLPLFLGFMTWVVIFLQGLSTRVEVINTKADEREILQADTREMIKENNITLKSKADQDINAQQHAALMGELEEVNSKVTRLYYDHALSLNIPHNDSVAQVTFAIKEKMDTAVAILQKFDNMDSPMYMGSTLFYKAPPLPSADSISIFDVAFKQDNILK